MLQNRQEEGEKENKKSGGRSKDRIVGRAPHRDHEQVTLLQDIARLKASKKEGIEREWLTVAQNMVLQELGLDEELTMTRGEKVRMVKTAEWKAWVQKRLESKEKRLDKLTKRQVEESRRLNDWQVRQSFLEEANGPSRFTGKRGDDVEFEKVRWVTPVGFQWMQGGGEEVEAATDKRIEAIKRKWPEAEVTRSTDSWKVLCMQIDCNVVGNGERAELMAAIDVACREWREREAAQLGEEFIQRIWRKVEDRGLQKGGQGLESVCQEVVAEVWRERSGEANKLQIGERGQTCVDEVRWYERGERAKERLEEWKQMVARGGEKQRHSLKVSWEGGEEERTVRVEYGGWEKAWEVSASGMGKVDRREQERERAESRRGKRDRRSTEEKEKRGEARIISRPNEEGQSVTIVTVKMKSLKNVSEMLLECGKGIEGEGIERKVIVEEGPWMGEDKDIALEQYFQTEGLSTCAKCQHCECEGKKPRILTKAPDEGSENKRRELFGFCERCWKVTDTRKNRKEVGDMDFLKSAGVFKKALQREGDMAVVGPAGGRERRRIRGKITGNELSKFVRGCLKLNKATGPEKYTNELLRAMTREELRVIQLWANRILTEEGTAESMTEEVMNGTIRLLHKGGDTVDLMSDWRPVVLLNVCNQLIMHVVNNRLRTIVEKGGILSPGQGGGRQGRSVTINTGKLEWVTERAQKQFKRLYRIDVDFRNAFNAMNQAAL